MAIVRIDADSPLQRCGVDVAVFVPALQRPIYVEEKFRQIDYGDFLVEEWSNLEQKKVGWTMDDKKISDYVAYHVPGKCYILHFPTLRKACQTYLEKWKATRHPKDVRNQGYVTRNWAIAWHDIWGGMALSGVLEVKV